MFASWMNRAAILGVDVREYRGLGKLRGFRNVDPRGLIDAFLGPVAPVTLCFFVVTLYHSHLPVQSQAPTPRWQGR